MLTGVGSLSRARIRFAERENAGYLNGPLELITLSGTVSQDGLHLHLSVSDAEGRMSAGHLMDECIIRTTAEVVFGIFPDWQFSRKHDPGTGYSELSVDPIKEEGLEN